MYDITTENVTISNIYYEAGSTYGSQIFYLSRNYLYNCTMNNLIYESSTVPFMTFSGFSSSNVTKQLLLKNIVF